MTITFMTASEKPAKHSEDLLSTEATKITPDVNNLTPQDAPKLPGVLLLLQKTFIIIGGLRFSIYGYAGWLLLPIVLIVFANNLPSPYGNLLLTVGEALSLILNLWVTSAIILFVTHMLIHKDGHELDFSDISKHSWNNLLKLFIVQTTSALAIAFGSMLLIVPGVVLWVWTAFATPDAVLRDRGIWQTFQYSYQLTRRRFWPILGRLLIGNGLLGLIAGALLIGYAIIGLQGSSVELIPTLTAWPSWLQTGFSLILIPILPIIVVFQLVLYIAAETTYSQPTEGQK
jgi:hypothetical protein